MEFELRKAKEKLEREQRERKEQAKRRLERERRAKAEAVRQQEALEAVQRTRRLEEARARLEEEQLMEENLILGKGVNFCTVLEACRYNGLGDKIKLPPSSFEELSDQGALDKGPMYFRLTKVNSEKVNQEKVNCHSTHCGVLEFTANEGTVQLPPHLWNNLFLLENKDSDKEEIIPLVELRYISLPKGTYAKLKPEGLGFYDLPNHKALLETSLRFHATLSEGDRVRVSYGETQYQLRVLELKPSLTVSVLETDIEVDIESLEGENQKQVLIPLEIGKSQNGTVQEGEFNYYKFTIDDAIGKIILSGSEEIEVRIQTDGNSQGDTDIYVSKHPLIFPTQHRHDWSSHETGSKTLTLKSKDSSSNSNSNSPSGTYTIGVFGYKGVTEYQISVHVREIFTQRVGEGVRKKEVTNNNGDLVECGNCKRYIARGTQVVHEAYCIRHNVLCRHEGCGIVLRKEESENHVHCIKCGRASKREEIEKHMKVFHEPIHCSCGVVLEKEEMVEHQSSACPLRLIVCQFCGDMVQAGSLPADPRDRLRGLCEHESVCGSRTAPCDSCGRSVMLKEMEIHIIAVHQNS